MNISKLIADIIPPNDYSHRNGFTNTTIIDNLNDTERLLVEDELIRMLWNDKDLLIVETLAYMKSLKAVPAIAALLIESSDPMHIIIITSSLFQINNDLNLIEKSANAFLLLNDKYQIISSFYYLKKFQNSITDSIIEKYITYPDYLISYNAKQALNG